MPGLEGREVLRRLRRAGTFTPVLLLAQVGDAGERAMALEEGAAYNLGLSSSTDYARGGSDNRCQAGVLRSPCRAVSAAHRGMRTENLALVLVETERKDWSFGRGQASYLELPREAWR